MRIFLSYASQDRATAQRINYALLAHGHDVFFDREDLVAGQEFDAAIARALDASDLFVFLIAPESVAQGRYTLSELQIAERRWPNPSAAVLPVLLRPTERDAIPAYLRAVNWLEPSGEIGAEVAAAVERLALGKRSGTRRRTLVAVGALLALIAGAFVVRTMWQTPAAPAPSVANTQPKEPPNPVPAALRERARAVASTDGGYVLALTAPNELRRMTDDHQPTGAVVPLPGEPTLVFESATQYIVATSNAPAVTVLRRADLSEVMPPIPLAVPSDAKVAVAPIVNALAVEGNVLWAATGGAGGARALLKQKTREWFVAQWTNGDYLRGDEPPWSTRHVRLQVVDRMLWAIAAPASDEPAQMLRIMNSIRVDMVSGRTFAPIACASDIADSSERTDGAIVLLSCGDELLDLSADGTNLHVERTVPTNVRAAGERRVDERIARSGTEVFAAMTMANSSGDVARTVVVRSGQSGAAIVGEVAGASIVSLTVSPRHVVAVVKRADGRFDVAVLPRTREAT